MTSSPLSIFWFRRDLRFEDNAGLAHALATGYPVLPIFIFDPDILLGLPKDDARVTFIFDTLQNLRSYLNEHHDSSIALYHGKPREVFEQLMQQFTVTAVYTNHDYEPGALVRDEAVGQWLRTHAIPLHTYKDHVIFEKNDIVKEDGAPYVVYTPYMRRWRSVQQQSTVHTYASEKKLDRIIRHIPLPNLSIEEIGFVRSAITVPAFQITSSILKDYAQTRDFPALPGTTGLSPHLRFGTVSVRKIFQQAQIDSEVFGNELIWREFFSQILWHFPHTPKQSFKARYDQIQWRNGETEFRHWCEGSTGYPLVDAGMRQLNATGLMHNRVRMITASFLCKHLLIDWRWGEAYFAEKLLDYDMASNVGNWQWVAGCGVDAAPYFRIFNPTAQLEKFDRHLEYVQTWVDEFNSFEYPPPIVDHNFARARYLKVYQQANKQPRGKTTGY